MHAVEAFGKISETRITEALVPLTSVWCRPNPVWQIGGGFHEPPPRGGPENGEVKFVAFHTQALTEPRICGVAADMTPRPWAAAIICAPARGAGQVNTVPGSPARPCCPRCNPPLTVAHSPEIGVMQTGTSREHMIANVLTLLGNGYARRLEQLENA